MKGHRLNDTPVNLAYHLPCMPTLKVRAGLPSCLLLVVCCLLIVGVCLIYGERGVAIHRGNNLILNIKSRAKIPRVWHD